jgi:hypothetical protein
MDNHMLKCGYSGVYAHLTTSDINVTGYTLYMIAHFSIICTSLEVILACSHPQILPLGAQYLLSANSQWTIGCYNRIYVDPSIDWRMCNNHTLKLDVLNTSTLNNMLKLLYRDNALTFHKISCMNLSAWSVKLKECLIGLHPLQTVTLGLILASFSSPQV